MNLSGGITTSTNPMVDINSPINAVGCSEALVISNKQRALSDIKKANSMNIVSLKYFIGAPLKS